MLDAPPRLAARPVLRIERAVAAPFAAVARVDTRSGALVTAVTLTLVSIAGSLVAVFQLGELFQLGTVARTIAIGVVIAWLVLTDSVEPLGLRLHDPAGALTGTLDTYRPVAAAWVSVARVVLLASVAGAALVGSVATVPGLRPVAGILVLFGLSLVASQAESVARRRAWQLTDGAPDHGSGGGLLGRDEELVHALTSGADEDPLAPRR